MASGQQSGAATRRAADVTDPSRSRRTRQAGARGAVLGGPAFISDQAEEQHHLDVLRDPAADTLTKATARLELARLYERHGHFAEAAEMYERNVWDGVRTPATYAGLAAAYRELGRDDLADAALEQVRRHGGAAGASRPDSGDTTAPLRRAQRTRPADPPGRPAVPTSRQPDTQRLRAPRTPTEPRSRGAARRASPAAQQDGPVAGTGGVLRQVQDSIAPFLAGQAGRRTLVASTVLLPIALGLVIFVGVVLTSARPRTTEQAAAPTPAPVATVAPTPAVAAAPAAPAVPPALAQPPAPAKLVVNSVGPDGVSLRKTPGVSGTRIKVWKDGTAMADLGESADQDGKSWRKVRDPDGNVGWTAAEYLADPSVRAMGAPGTGAPAAPPFASGGLGLSRAEWEQGHGQPSRSSIFLEYDGGRLVVGLLESNVWHIERIWVRNEAVSLDAAREDARAYLPSDANLGQSVDRGDGKVIDVYSSSILTGRFGTAAWNGGKPGTFTIQYKLRGPNDRMVVSAMFRLGDAGF